MARSLPPLISARALGSIPDFIDAEIGPVAFDRIMSRSGMPYPVLEHRDLFIPQTMLVSYFHHAAREFGEHRLGLLLAPHITVAEYDVWGEYVLTAPTLGESLLRVTKVIGLHTNDTVAVSAIDQTLMKIAYSFHAHDAPGYDTVAPCAIGAVSSIFKSYLGPAWRPVAVDLDIVKPTAASGFEDVFGCPVRFGRRAVAIYFLREQTKTKHPIDGPVRLTAADVARKRRGGAPTTASGKVAELISLQLLDGAPDMEDAASKLGVGPRKLQRTLATEGVTFRELANAAVAVRSRELLTDSFLSVTEIAVRLGYSSPSHFSRAFRTQTGQSPSDFRMLGAAVPHVHVSV